MAQTENKFPKKEMTKVIDELEIFINKIDEKLEYFPELDSYFGELVEEAREDIKENLTKKQKKEKAIALVKERFPNLLKALNTLDDLSNGLIFVIEEKREALEKLQTDLSELEDIKEECERLYDEVM